MELLRVGLLVSVSFTAAACGGSSVAPDPGESTGTTAQPIAIELGTYYYVKSEKYGDCMGVPFGNAANGTRVTEEECTGRADQMWLVSPNADGTHTLVNMNSDLCLDTPNSDTSPGNPLQLWNCFGGAGQHYVLDKSPGKGLYELRPATDRSKVIAISGCAASAGSSVNVQENAHGACANWYLVKASAPTVSFQSEYADGRYFLSTRMDRMPLGSVYAGTGAFSRQEKFRAFAYTNGQYSFQSQANGLFVSVRENDGNKLQAITAHPRSWELFAPQFNPDDGSFALLANTTGKYVSADFGPNSADPQRLSSNVSGSVGAAGKYWVDGNALGGTADYCPFDGGISFGGKRRFMHGANWAWNVFGEDFSGDERNGIMSNEAVINAQFDALASSGVNVVRVWLFPDFRGNGVSFDASGNPQWVDSAVWPALDTLLSIADERDIYLLLTLFSFDGMKTAQWPTLQPLVQDQGSPPRRGLLMDRVVKPIVHHVMHSGLQHRVAGWDFMNEPEWAVSEFCSGGYGCGANLTPPVQQVWKGDMEKFVSDGVDAIHDAGGANVTVGTADQRALGWWTSNQDFYTAHVYNQWHGLGAQGPTFRGKPVVIGEFLLSENDPKSFYDRGFAGALSWSFSDHGAEYTPSGSHATLRQQRPCTTSF